MTIGILFILGIANFALHRAMLDSDHPLLAMLLAANGWPSAAWVYALYTLINAGTAWVLLGGSD